MIGTVYLAGEAARSLDQANLFLVLPWQANCQVRSRLHIRRLVLLS